MNRTVTERDERIEALNRTVADRDERTGALNGTVAERDERIEALNRAVAERDGLIEALNQVVADRDDLIGALTSSKSWRITAPLRAGRRWMGQLAFKSPSPPMPQLEYKPEMEDGKDQLRWSIESMVIRGEMCIMTGWMFHEDEDVTDLRLENRQKNGRIESFRADTGRFRGDVINDYPEFPHSTHSGYTIFSDRIGHVGSSTMFLRGKLSGGRAFEIRVPDDLIKHHRNKKLSNFSPKSYLTEQEANRAVLIVDHSMGGGANHHRDYLIDQQIRYGRTTLLLSCKLEDLSYTLEIRTSSKRHELRIPGYEHLEKILGQIDIGHIIYNNAVSFMHPIVLLNFMMKLKDSKSPRLTLMVHDFFMACPSYTLVDHDGIYCGIPATSRCRKCLPRNNHTIAIPPSLRDISKWRQHWGAVIRASDEIKVFSDDSREIIRRAYPSIDPEKISVEPHDMNYFAPRRIRLTHTANMRLGVVGRITYHKGSRVVLALSEEIRKQDLDIQIIIIGTIEESYDRRIIQELGAYNHSQLPSLIEESGVNTILFPSIWPETFSYVCHELVALDMPIACFDLGAPAKLVGSYERGLILRSMAAPIILEELTAFHHRLYMPNGRRQ